MNLKETVHNSFGLLRQNKVRSFLTMLGIVIGIMGVMVIMAAGSGAQSLIFSQIQSQGSNLIAVFPGGTEEDGPPVSVMGIVVTTLKYADLKALEDPKECPGIVAVSGYVQGTDTVTWNGNKTDTTFIGASAALPEVEDTGVQIGHFFMEEDESSLAKVAVLGSQVWKDLFGDQDPVGERVKIGKHSFRVVGVMRERGTQGFSNQDDQIYVPLTTAQKLLIGINYVSFGRIKVDEGVDIDQVVDKIKIVLRERHDLDFGEPDDFDVSSQKDALDALLSITNALKFFLTAIASIALVVGGIGIMNIMLVSVQERIREIGLRKALGARKKQIMFQFLVETVIITTIAGILGIILGLGISYLIAKVVQFLGYTDWEYSVSLTAIVISVGISSIIGFIFGLIPARRASRLNPIEALRYE